MRPTGHLLTTTAACGLSYAVGGSLHLTAGLLLGGFLIDLDHYFDYVVFEGQRSLNPQKFLNYYLDCKLKRAVLILHSYELMAALGLVAVFTSNQLLIGYLLGAMMHLGLDIYFNGKHVLREPIRFYSFIYSREKGFEASRMIDVPSQHLSEQSAIAHVQ